ncbi:MAG: PilN domain-containing protein, partial [Deltaproteobacteria bacterium]
IPLDEEAKADFLTDFGQFKGEQITMMLRPVLERLVMEVTRTIGYYVKTFKSDRIEELYLTGGSSRLKNIDKFLLFNVEGIQKVQPLNILKPVKGWSERLHQQELVMEQAAPHMAVAFGLCMGSGGKVNMLPAKEKLEQKANLLSMLLKFAFPAVLVLNLVFYSGVYFNGVKYKMFVGKLDSDISRLEPVAQKVREYRAQSQKLTEKAQLLERAKGTQPSWLGVMRELSALVPQEISLTRIVTEEKTKPVRIRISGVIFPPKYTIADLALSQFVMTLEESPFFRQVELVSVRKNTDSQVASADFEIRCALNY